MAPIGNAATDGPGAPDSGSLATIRWTDKSFSADRTRLGANLKPDFDFTNLGLLFPQNDASERVYILDQMLHQKKLGTGIKLHVHFVQDEVPLPNFKCDYRFYRNGQPIPGFTTIQTDDGSGPGFSYTGTPLVNIVPFPEIPPPSGETVSSILDLILYRDDNRVTGDVLVKYIDYHFQVDGSGSRQEFAK